MPNRSDDGVAQLIEAYFAHWLKHADIGPQQVATLGFEGAMDALWEALNLGFIKLEGDQNGITGILPIHPPEPPESPLQRPKGARH
jgi:hypothetical protein